MLDRGLPFHANSLFGVQIAHFGDPVEHGGDAGVDSGVDVFAASDTPGHHTNLFPMITLRNNKRSAAVTL